MRTGFCGCRPNERIATALVLEGNLGLRISDITKLRLENGNQHAIVGFSVLQRPVFHFQKNPVFSAKLKTGHLIQSDTI